VNKSKILVRNAISKEFQEIGSLLVNVYSKLDGFPTPIDQPKYYESLKNIGEFTKTPGTELLVAVNVENQLMGAVLYFRFMKYYGSGGEAPKIKNASGFRLLAVDFKFRDRGVGRLLINKCIQKTKEQGNEKLIIHSTKSMEIAWEMYEKIGFKRVEELDFLQRDYPVYGFKLTV